MGIRKFAWGSFRRHRARMVEIITFVSRSLAYTGSCFVLNACGIISEKMREFLPYIEEERVFLADPENGGGSSIIGASSSILAGPMSGREEGILTADIDLEDCVRKKIIQDYAGHYNRPDVFQLKVNASVPDIFHTEEAGPTFPAGVQPAATKAGEKKAT